MNYLLAKDTISGQEARAYLEIDGRNELMFYAKSIEAVAKKNKVDVRTIGKRGVQHKTVGWTGSGSMTMYYATSKFRQLMLDYIKTGVDTYFNMMIINDDPTSDLGRQTVVLKRVNLDSVKMASFDVKSDTLDEKIDFTFEEVDILEKFAN